MKRAVLCVQDPWNYIDQLNEYSLMIIDPNAGESRKKYLLDNSDWSLLITESGTQTRSGQHYPNERLLWYTSGTTGNSKFYSFSQEQLDLKSKFICKAHNITIDDHYVSIMPLWHGHGQSMYWAAKYAGCRISFVTVANIRTVADLDPTFLSATPNIIKLLARQKYRCLRWVRTSSQKLPNSVFWELRKQFNVPVIETYGLTEALGHVMSNPIDGEQREGTVGLPNGFDAKIIDGELYLKGPTMFTDQWYATGDLAKQDSAGYYIILGRKIEVINLHGYKIDPLAVEGQLYNLLSKLEEVVVFGKTHLACVYVGPYSEHQVRIALLQTDPHHNPKFLKKVDQIPKNNNKISRAQLVEYFAQ